MPKQVSGTTNDGNTARRFFEDPSFAARVTGLDENLIYRFSIILKVLSCGKAIKTDHFRAYSLETAKLFCKLYKWYYMPASVHKVIVIIYHFNAIPQNISQKIFVLIISTTIDVNSWCGNN